MSPWAPPRPCRRCRRATTEARGFCAACKPLAEKGRLTLEPGRAWYQTPVWRALRAEVLLQWPLCVLCLREKRVTPSKVADHVRAHMGRRERFFDLTNLIGICAEHHGVKGGWERHEGHERELREYERYCDELRAGRVAGISSEHTR
jgi:5-methylcytosine-specific restriction endonuclease McrA